ncbi:MAG: DUF2061 domain-containing protein [Paracoccaceae bacterium]|jgi:uncharacterized membrane protein|nr:DUF2061 domain-containing protein [Paracoccaceae bacterium]MDG1737549.1 DUF2061 domain-containing protein [Paracoccaceae bacterium]MDG2257481.1 DUF2061 domain-containing protein [Paracoccaceae bacterium]
METRKRSLVKAVIWNALGLTIMALVGFFMTGSFATGGIIALANTILGFSMYLGYERIWANIRWGRHV